MGDYFNQTHSGSGNNVINFGKQQFQMTNDVMNEVVRQLGPPRSLKLGWVGSQKSFQDSQKLAAFLKARGFEIIEEGGTDILSPPLEGPVQVIQGILFVDSSK